MWSAASYIQVVRYTLAQITSQIMKYLHNGFFSLKAVVTMLLPHFDGAQVCQWEMLSTLNITVSNNNKTKQPKGIHISLVKGRWE